MGDQVISNTEALQETFHPTQMACCKRWPALRAVGHQDDLQAHHEKAFPRMLILSVSYTSPS